MVVISTRVPAELADALDAWAAERRATRAAIIRALVEDAVDAGELPHTPMQSTSELLAELRAAEDEQLRELSRR